ncbi:hypothetical protein ABG067_004398 [Albugo candida]|uniref:Uncharacterized protein n=1 Tax=Albugo candida TaxID=65357 RepID=A0A024GSS4_9STRA|nr:unnamed protein product [Albugo candida]|eukprot:CCI49624.1 unnamed protein product [Albugo candida]
MRDPLFEFDAPTRFLDLTALSTAKKDNEEFGSDERKYDKWFDVLHEDHSKPSIYIIKTLSKHALKKKIEMQNKRDSLENVRKEGWGERRVIVENQNSERHRKQIDKKSANFAVATSDDKKLRKDDRLVGNDKKRNISKIKSSNDEKKRFVALTTRQGAQMNQMASIASKRRVRDQADAKRDDAELQQLLDKHNRGIKRTKHTYEPRHHSVRDVRLWEKHSKKKYYDLSPSSRVTANAEISKLLEDLRSE